MAAVSSIDVTGWLEEQLSRIRDPCRAVACRKTLAAHEGEPFSPTRGSRTLSVNLTGALAAWGAA